jgi:hypothetical protein
MCNVFKKITLNTQRHQVNPIKVLSWIDWGGDGRQMTPPVWNNIFSFRLEQYNCSIMREIKKKLQWKNIHMPSHFGTFMWTDHTWACCNIALHSSSVDFRTLVCHTIGVWRYKHTLACCTIRVWHYNFTLEPYCTLESLHINLEFSVFVS